MSCCTTAEDSSDATWRGGSFLTRAATTGRKWSDVDVAVSTTDRQDTIVSKVIWRLTRSNGRSPGVPWAFGSSFPVFRHADLSSSLTNG